MSKFIFLVCLHSLAVIVAWAHLDVEDSKSMEPKPSPPVQMYVSPLGLFLPSIYQIPLKTYRLFPGPKPQASESSILESRQAVPKSMTTPSTPTLPSFAQRLKMDSLSTNHLPDTFKARAVPSERLLKRIVFTAPDLQDTINDLKLEK